MTSRRLIFAPVAVLASLGLLACGGDDDATAGVGDTSADVDDTGDAAPDDDSPDLDLGPDELTIEQGDDSFTMGAELPDDFPVWAVHLPEDFSILQVQQRDAASTVQWIVVGSVPKAPDSVEFELLGFYGDPDEHSDENGAIRMVFSDHNGFQVSFTLQENADGDTTTTLSVMEL